MRMRLRTCTFLVILFAFGARLATAQEWRGDGRVEGSVVDRQGAPIVGAVIAFRWAEDGRGPDIKTDKKGRWAYYGLNGGKWNVDISAAGYLTKKVSVNVSQAGRNAKIEAILDPAVEAKPEKPAEEFLVGGKKISKEAAAALKEANEAWDAKEWAKARAGYEKALVELPGEEALLEHVELACYNDKKYDGALEYARKIVAINPGNTTSWLMIAEIDLQNGKLDEGKEALLKVPDEKISDPRPYVNLGINYYNKARQADAEEWFTKAITKKPEAVDNSDAYFYRALARYSLKRMADSKSDLEKYLALNPQGENAETAKELLNSMKKPDQRPAQKKPPHASHQ